MDFLHRLKIEALTETFVELTENIARMTENMARMTENRDYERNLYCQIVS